MKVFSKKEDISISGIIFLLVFALLFFIGGIGIIYGIICFLIEENGERFSFLVILYPGVWCIPCFKIAWHWGTGSLVSKKHKAKLINKEKEIYNDQEITYMTFSNADIDENVRTFESHCYTYGDNNLIENKEYIVIMNEANYQVKAVEEVDNQEVKANRLYLKPIILLIAILAIRIFAEVCFLVLF